jgi:hypothetical protein
MDQLPDEIITEIFRYLNKGDHSQLIKDQSSLNKSIRPSAMCNRRLRRIASSLLYHTIFIFTLDQLDGLLLMMIESPQYAKFVKHLTVYEQAGRVSALAFEQIIC